MTLIANSTTKGLKTHALSQIGVRVTITILLKFVSFVNGRDCTPAGLPGEDMANSCTQSSSMTHEHLLQTLELLKNGRKGDLTLLLPIQCGLLKITRRRRDWPYEVVSSIWIPSSLTSIVCIVKLWLQSLQMSQKWIKYSLGTGKCLIKPDQRISGLKCVKANWWSESERQALTL